MNKHKREFTIAFLMVKMQKLTEYLTRTIPNWPIPSRSAFYNFAFGLHLLTLTLFCDFCACSSSANDRCAQRPAVTHAWSKRFGMASCAFYCLSIFCFIFSSFLWSKLGNNYHKFTYFHEIYFPDLPSHSLIHDDVMKLTEKLFCQGEILFFWLLLSLEICV